MIDINCHILPGVDDGASTLTESLAMAREATRQGIHTIVATPHHKNGRYNNTGKHIIDAVGYLNGKLLQENIQVEIIPGQRTRIHGEVLQDLRNGDMLSYNINSNYVLIELPNDEVPLYLSQLLFDMQIAGYKPIIAHPERNQELMRQPDKLYQLVKNGALTQVTASSLVGSKGSKVQKFVNQLVESNLTHFVASNAHREQSQGFCIREAIRMIRKQHGSAKAHQFIKNSESLLTGLIILTDVPERIRNKSIWRIVKGSR